MNDPVIVVHYHELWLKGGNRRFFLGKLFRALRQSLQGIPVQRIEQPGDRFLVRLGPGAPLDEAKRVSNGFSASHTMRWGGPSSATSTRFAALLGKRLSRSLSRRLRCALSAATKNFPRPRWRSSRSWAAICLKGFARQRSRGASPAKGSRNHLPHRNYAGTAAGVRAKNPGAGGLPANTAGRLTCLLSGGYDSAVAAYHMMKRGAHLSFVHFYGTGAEPGESSLHVARATRAHARAISIWGEALPSAV